VLCGVRGDEPSTVLLEHGEHWYGRVARLPHGDDPAVVLAAMAARVATFYYMANDGGVSAARTAAIPAPRSPPRTPASKPPST
jgi:hypothetical protein